VAHSGRSALLFICVVPADDGNNIGERRPGNRRVFCWLFQYPTQPFGRTKAPESVIASDKVVTVRGFAFASFIKASQQRMLQLRRQIGPYDASTTAMPLSV